MDGIDRRHLLKVTAGAAFGALLPGTALSLEARDGLADRLRFAQEMLADLELESASCACCEAVAVNFPSWGLLWKQSYIGTVRMADGLRQFITDDTPETRAILAKARAILPPACERAETFWQPIPDLSPKFRKASKRYYYLRAARIAFRGDTKQDFRRALMRSESRTLQLRAKSPGDWELKRRILQSRSQGDMHDVAHLRARLTDWKSYIDDAFETRCGALPCKRCEQWFA